MVSSSQTLDYHWAKTLYERHPVLAAFRKRADGFAAMVAFLHEVFEKRRQSRYVEPDLVHQLTDFWLATDPLNENAKAPANIWTNGPATVCYGGFTTIYSTTILSMN